MKKKIAFCFILIFILISLSGISQLKVNQKLLENTEPNDQFTSSNNQMELSLQASVQTTQVKNITSTSASCGYIIKSEGVIISSHGICINKGPSPTTANTKFAADKSPGPSFNVQITKLTPNMKYYIRSYIITNTGTIYGNELSFTTLPAK